MQPWFETAQPFLLLPMLSETFQLIFPTMHDMRSSISSIVSRVFAAGLHILRATNEVVHTTVSVTAPQVPVEKVPCVQGLG